MSLPGANNRSVTRWSSIGLAAVGIAAFAATWLQRQEAASLRTVADLLRQENEEIARLRAEGERLRATAIPDAQLQRMRGDRDALLRLRREIEILNERVRNGARDVAATPASRLPAVVRISLAEDGRLLVDGSPADLSGLRQQFANFAAGATPLDLRVAMVSAEKQSDQVKQTITEIARLAKESGLRFTLKLEPSK